MKRWLSSNCNGVVISCNKNKTCAIFKTHVFCLSSNFLLHEMSCKNESLIPQRYAWKTLCSGKMLLVTHGKHYLLRELSRHTIIMSLERNRVKLSNIRGLWKKKKYSEENIMLIHWQILKLLILAVPVRQVSQKMTMLSR